MVKLLQNRQFINKLQSGAEQRTGGFWLVIDPPRRWKGASREAIEPFVVYMLLPGISVAFHAETLGKTRATVKRYRRRANALASTDPILVQKVMQATAQMSAQDGLAMARVRKRAQLPHWSRLAIAEMRKQGLSSLELAKIFECSCGTINNIVAGRGTPYHPLTGVRALINKTSPFTVVKAPKPKNTTGPNHR